MFTEDEAFTHLSASYMPFPQSYFFLKSLGIWNFSILYVTKFLNFSTLLGTLKITVTIKPFGNVSQSPNQFQFDIISKPLLILVRAGPGL